MKSIVILSGMLFLAPLAGRADSLSNEDVARMYFAAEAAAQADSHMQAEITRMRHKLTKVNEGVIAPARCTDYYHGIKLGYDPHADIYFFQDAGSKIEMRKHTLQQIEMAKRQAGLSSSHELMFLYPESEMRVGAMGVIQPPKPEVWGTTPDGNTLYLATGFKCIAVVDKQTALVEAVAKVSVHIPPVAEDIARVASFQVKSYPTAFWKEGSMVSLEGVFRVEEVKERTSKSFGSYSEIQLRYMGRESGVKACVDDARRRPQWRAPIEGTWP